MSFPPRNFVIWIVFVSSAGTGTASSRSGTRTAFLCWIGSPAGTGTHSRRANSTAASATSSSLKAEWRASSSMTLR